MYVDTVKILFQNTNGWVAKAPALKLIFRKHDPDILLVAHTSVANDFPLKFFPYRCYHHNTATLYSGVAIFIKPHIKHSLISHQFQSDTIALRVETSHGPIVLATNYTPPSRQSLPTQDLNWLASLRTPAYLLADLNAHHHMFDYYTNPRGKDLHDSWLSFGSLKVLGPDEGTFRTNRGRLSKPDIAMGNRACFHHCHISNLEKNISDHAPFLMTLSCHPIRIPCRRFEDLAHADWQAYSSYIKSKISPINLNNSPTTNIQPALDNLTKVLTEAKQFAIPTKIFRLNTKVEVSPKFARLQKILVCMYNLLESYRRDPARYMYILRKKNDTINELKTEAIIIQNNNWFSMLSKMISNRSRNPKSYWAKIKSIINKKNTGMTFLVTDTGTKAGNILVDHADIESSFRRTCINKYQPPPANRIDPTARAEVQAFHAANPNIAIPLDSIDLSRLPSDSLTLKPFRPRETLNIINNFKNKAPGPDEVRRIHLLKSHKILIVNLTKLLNYALSAGLYPQSFKDGMMVFIAKKGKDLSNPSNYRPITLINIFGKIYGKLLNLRFVLHMEQKKLLNPLQFGFRRGRGTTSSLALTCEFIARKKGSDLHGKSPRVSVVARDVSGAFDRVWHDCLVLLFSKLYLPPLFVKVISNFLKDRTLRIKIFDYIGPMFGMTAGVPQGAPDSPDFFNVTTLALGHNFNGIHTFTYDPWYADDQLQVVAPNFNRAHGHLHHINKAIVSQNNFESTRGILTCSEKSIIIPFGFKLPKEVKVPFQGNTLVYPSLQGAASTKLLGLSVSSRSFTAPHIKISRAIANNILSSLYSLRGLDQRSKLILIKTLIMPILTYPVTPLNTASIFGMVSLQKVLNRGLRFVYNVKWQDMTTSKSLHLKAKISPINVTIHNRAVQVWEKIKNGIAADIETFRTITSLDYNKPNSWFPSSYTRAQKAEPPPIFTRRDTHSRRINNYYKDA